MEEEYFDHLRVERGLAPNTLLAYGNDIGRLRAFAGARGRDLLDLKQADVAEFMGELRDAGLSRALGRRGPCTRSAGSTASRCARAGSTRTRWRT